MKKYFWFFLSIILTNKSICSKAIDFIQNGWIESTNNQTLFRAACNPDYGLNSRSSFVQKANSWYPIHGYLYKNLPLCFKKCPVQSFIPNGQVRVNSRRQSRQIKYNSTGFFLDLIQGDSISYQCQKGYFLQQINSNKYLSFKSKTIRCRTNSKNLDSSEDERVLFECIQYCQQPKFNSTLTNGFLAPIRSYYKPGEQIGFYCNEGFASKINFYHDNNLTDIISNVHRLECVRDGIWGLRNNDNSNLTNIQILKDTFLPLCLRLDFLMYRNNVLKDQIDYKNLNIHSLNLIFSLVGLIIGLLFVSLMSIRAIRMRRGVSYVNFSNSRLRSNSNPSNLINSDTNSSPNFGLLPIHGAFLRSTPQSECLASPPSYEQLFTGSSSSRPNNLANASRIDFSVNLNLSSNQVSSRSRANRTEMSRKSKSSAMRKKIIDKRRKTNSHNEACSSNQS